MFKERLLREILDFVEKRRKVFFTKEEFFIHLWYKCNVTRDCGALRFETIARQLRDLARQGFLARAERPIPEWGFCYYVVYYINKNRIRAYLQRMERGIGILAYS